MSELRKDYILNRWVIISQERYKRPKQFIRYSKKIRTKRCFFCRGNENLTPPTTYKVEVAKKWVIRSFPNKFPAVSESGKPGLKIKNNFFCSSFAYGWHEILVDSPRHDKQLAELSPGHIKKVLKAFSNRIIELSKNNLIKYVVVFKNHGSEAGTSIIHSHCQVIAFNHVPEILLDEVAAVSKFKKCPFCDIIKKERKSERKIFENETMVSFAPYASVYPYEVCIFPKRHVLSLIHLSEKEFKDLAQVLKKILIKLDKLKVSYNFYLHNAPGKKNLHFHIKITPRMNVFGGFELSTGVVINTVPPEKAAEFYRGKKNG